MNPVGNMYVADSYSYRIRKITNSIITTTAGTGTSGFSGDNSDATSATLNYPSGITVDSSGNVIFSDVNNHRVRKIDALTNYITTIAGSASVGYFYGDGGAATSARLNNPTGVALDSSGT